MRRSPLLHPLAILRTTIGLTQREMGDLVNRAARTIQAIELGKLPLSEELALRLAEATGVDESWLLEGKPEAPPRRGIFLLRTARAKGVYTQQDYEFYRAIKEAPVVSGEELLAENEKAKREHRNIDVSLASIIKSGGLKHQLKELDAMDQDLRNYLGVLLEDSRFTEVTFLTRWKIRRFFEELAKEVKIPLPPPGMLAEEISAARQKAQALAKERKSGVRIAPDYPAVLAKRRAQEKSAVEGSPARKDKESAPLRPRIVGRKV